MLLKRNDLLSDESLLTRFYRDFLSALGCGGMHFSEPAGAGLQPEEASRGGSGMLPQGGAFFGEAKAGCAVWVRCAALSRFMNRERS